MSYPFSFRWTKRHEDFCLSEKIFLGHVLKTKNVYRKKNIFLLQKGDKITINCDIHVEENSTMPYKGFCSMGAYSYCCSSFPNEMSIGRYCSIANGVTIMGTQHPIHRFTTSPITYHHDFIKNFVDDIHAPYITEPFNEELPLPCIGHDVWIGANVVLKGNITIGNGAVIGANSVVTKDVPPYAIVAGVPAKIIKFRFETNEIERLSLLSWWDYKYIDLPITYGNNIDLFISELSEKIEGNTLKKENYKKTNLSYIFKTLC
ncbi:CatB-related O-acetyltransferase [Pectobacterium fontis]|uniref:Acetyltransferase n=1 Tax=Pectobacterium fontis TaxID=2558042 RepID=A0A7V8L5U1_9GAMM|nr:CatB-related O-acetyltransferase [Pectobacterium fontis]KHN53082.1 acetyltransferase [Pectobacterium fontis]